MITRPPKVLLLINGGRKPVASDLVEKLAAKLYAYSSTSQTTVTYSMEHALIELEKARTGEFEAVWVAGGDGSLFLAANKLINSPVSLGIIPLGTVNALAKSLKISLEPLQAMDELIKFGHPFPLDVGNVNDQYYFLCFGSVGFDAVVVKNVRLREKRYWGRLAYIFQGIRELKKSCHNEKFSLRYIDENNCDRAAQACSVIFSNIKNYAGLTLFPEASPEDQLFETVIVRSWKPSSLIKWTTLTLASRRRQTTTFVARDRIRYIVISGEDLTIQLDGESVILDNSREIEIRCIPGGINFWGLKHNYTI